MEVFVEINNQKLSFLKPKTVCLSKEEAKEITIIPYFSSNWDRLEKYITVFFNERDYKSFTMNDDYFTLREELISPGVAFNFYGKYFNDEYNTYLLPTNYLKIFIKD
jgi:hypothetical protein